LSAASRSLPGHDPLPVHDPDRLGRLLGGLEPRLLAVAVRLTRDRDAARDVVQSAFEKALRNAGQFRGEALVSTWLHRIVTNEAFMWLRREGRLARRCVSLEDPLGAALPDPAPEPFEQAMRRERQLRVRAGMATLRAEEREVLELCALEGRSYAQLAERTGDHPAALKSRAFRARRRLGVLLGEA
jgi:RNA polymerase sigma-70 factor (ECF subfamily)